ncbi:MAG: PD-(D/E)XK nuclease family protein [Endomicrobium sp.]|jgi:hypothetical protein|nr:PD-(D/E)XK nuclease family protein [Endomicrobium sp.]
MSKKIINININEDIIDIVSDYVFKSKNKIALICGGKRPFLFFKKKLAEKYNKSFFPPYFFTHNDFIDKLIFDHTNLRKSSTLEIVFMLYKIIKDKFPQLLNEISSFKNFIEWGFEIFSFIEQLDFEDVPEKRLKFLSLNAEIGYDVPEFINKLLKNIFEIRNIFHNNLEKTNNTTDGYNFLKASYIFDEKFVEDFDEIILVAPFYLYKTELKIFKKIYSIGKITIFIQGDPKKYETLKEIYAFFGEQIPIIKDIKNKYNLNIYSVYDSQSQGALIRNIISSYKKKDLDKTIIVVPDSNVIQSIESEISMITNNYNISVGYPICKIPILTMIFSIIDAQLLRKKNFYNSKSIIAIFNNQFFKNMIFFNKKNISKIISNNVEKMLNQYSKNCLSGKMFVLLSDIIYNNNLIHEIDNTLIYEAYEYIDNKKIVNILIEIFNDFFIVWEKIDTLFKLSEILCFFLKKIYKLSIIKKYPSNIEAIKILYSISEEMKTGNISTEKMNNDEIFYIFKKMINDKNIVLPGSSVKGLQILGFLESRNITFDNVFIANMNDSAIPMMKKDYALIPKNIMYSLGIYITKKDYEIQKYHFDRLVSCSKTLNLIFLDDDKYEKSRFLEKIIWDNQLKNKDLNSIKITKFIVPNFFVNFKTKKKFLKTKDIKKYLKNMFYTYTKIDTYLNCKLKFYYKYVLKVFETKQISDDILNLDIGIFVHNFLMEVFHEKLDNDKIKSLDFKKFYFMKLNEKLKKSVFFNFREDFFMIKKILTYKMQNILHYENLRTFETIYACEKKYISKIETKLKEEYNLCCIIDRIDIINNTYTIFDYKTGYVNNIINKKFFDIMKRDYKRQNIRKAINSLQLPLYKYVFEKNTGFIASCGIYDIKKIKIVMFPMLNDIYNECINVLKTLIYEINNEEYFEFYADDRIKCSICEYFYMCR